MIEPPAIVRLTVCLSCGSNDRWRYITKRHYVAGKHCPQPELVTIDYLLPMSFGGHYPDKEPK